MFKMWPHLNKEAYEKLEREEREEKKLQAGDDDDKEDIVYHKKCPKCKGKCMDCTPQKACQHGFSCNCLNTKCVNCNFYPLKPFPHV